MQLALYGKSLELTPSLRAYVEQRLNKLDRFFTVEVPAAQVVLSVQRERQIIEVTIPLDGMLLRAEEADASMYAAIDLVLAKLERQIHKYKTRAHRRPRPSGREDYEAIAAEPEESVVRVKRFPLKPMSVEEALLQMNLLGHDFFMFRDAASEEVQVVYRRRHGGYGLIAAG